ncbi:hypothetical protein GLOIN_2v1776429 [Rhizophagus clarus]|uniref:Uncharacterized protein n=1 Tax=Rhizophagus clarus TaxID=94130 RepID=A0A8H3MEH8_9GLOM|nr:hypothetical protein GLOIN_2v1776429 [Rhizophagus clarus]
MLRNKPQKVNIATLPFHIRNNFRRLPNRFLLSDNDDNEKMVQKDFEDNNISGEEYNEYGDRDDNLEQRKGDTNMISTSSENETESDYIMFLESDEECETMSSDNEERHDSDISEEKLFVDEILAKHKLPSYDDFVDIIMRPEFNRDHIVKNIQRFRAWRERLPLPSISAKSISISSKKTPSTLKDSKIAY